MEKKYKVEYEGGESREYPGKGCDCMICWVDDADRDAGVMYAEIVCPDDVTEDNVDAWSDSVYDDLKAEIIRQAKDYGITEDQLVF